MTSTVGAFLPVPTRPDVETCVEFARRVEEFGYERVWLTETWGRDAVTTLTSVARETETIGVGASILPAYSRSPALLGQTAVTLQEISDSRVRIGVGPSGPAVMEGWHGAEFGNPLKRTRETIEIARLVVSGDQVTYDGEHFEVGGFRLRCEPPEQGPRIDAAGIGPKAAELAGRFADGWHALMLTKEGLRERLDDFRRGVTLGGRDPADRYVMATVFCCVRSDGERAKRLLKDSFAFYIGAFGPYFSEAIARQGHEEVVETVTTRWENGEREAAAASIPDALLAELAVWGTPETARERLDDFRAIDGVDAVGITYPQATDMEGVHQTANALAPDPAR